MSNLHPNATPNMVFTGAKESAAAGPSPVSASFGNLTTLNFIKGNWGPLDDAMAVNDNVTGERIYGASTFDINSLYYNYQTVLATGLMGKAVSQFLVRIADAAVKKAGARLLMEYVLDDIDPMNRNLDGTFALTAEGVKVLSGSTVAGYRVRFLLEKSDGTMITGAGAVTAGTLTGKAGSVSTIVPIADFEATYFGTRGNQLMLSLFQPGATTQIPVDTASIESTGAMLYRLAVRELSANGGSSVPWYTVDSNETVDFTLQPKVRNRLGAVSDFATRYRQKHTLRGQLTNGANIVGPIDGVHWYDANIKTALELFHAAEKTARLIPGDNTIWIDDTNVHSINLFGPTNHKSIPYRAIAHSPLTGAVVDARQIVLSTGSPAIRLTGGHDGDLSDAAFNTGVKDLMMTFGNGIPLGDLKHYPFHWIFDMGLSLETTKSLYRVMAGRPDVAVLGATHEHGIMDTDDQVADKVMAIAATAMLIPESVIYSVAATRGSIVPYSIRIKNHQYTDPISLNYRIAMKMADYLGSNDLVWDVDKDPLHKDNKNIEDELLNYRYRPYSFREKMWANQAVAIESTGHNVTGIVGLQSLNPNDSSPLNSLIAVAGLVQATWAMAMAYGEWAGGTMTPAQIITRCNNSIAERVKGVDGSKVVITPRTQVTPDDYKNGFSFTMTADMECGYQYTAATITVAASYLATI
jgi:hypothetical protein